MKKNKVLKIVLTVLGVLVVLLAAAALAVVLYLRSMAASLPDSLPSADAGSTAEVTLTDDDLDKLLSGEITLDDLTSSIEQGASSAEDASASASAEEPAASDSVASSDSAASSSASSSAASGSQGGSTTSSAQAPASSSGSSASGRQEAGYEAEVKALIQQLYSVKARAEADLNACVDGAKAEYKALPESQQTQAKKVSIALSRSGKLYAMQAAYDKEVDSIVDQMRTVLTENGQSTALADQALASYKAQKSATYSQLMAKLYS